MKRLHFILLLFLSSTASVFGMKPDRERMARAWLKENGFVIVFRQKEFDGEVWYWVKIWNNKLGDTSVSNGSGWDKTSHEPILTPALDYLAGLDWRGFVIEQKHFVKRDERDVDFPFKEVEDAPPTLHRFTRPEWL